jgi:hypothetical protein
VELQATCKHLVQTKTLKNPQHLFAWQPSRDHHFKYLHACGIHKPWKVTKVTSWGENIITNAFHITTSHFHVMKDKWDGYSHMLHINSTVRKYNPCFGNFSRKLTPFTINNSRFSTSPYLHISSHTHNWLISVFVARWKNCRHR